jgi:hypothetical protein
MRRITYLRKFRSFVLSMPKLNPTQTRRLVRKSASSRAIGSTERVSEGGQLTQLQHCRSPQRCCSTSRPAHQRRREKKRVESHILFLGNERLIFISNILYAIGNDSKSGTSYCCVCPRTHTILRVSHTKTLNPLQLQTCRMRILHL